jgi:hypothetical protein
MEIREARIEIWKIEQHIQRIVETFEKETGLIVEDIFLLRENVIGNCGGLQGVDMKVIIQGAELSFVRRVQ